MTFPFFLLNFTNSTEEIFSKKFHINQYSVTRVPTTDELEFTKVLSSNAFSTHKEYIEYFQNNKFDNIGNFYTEYVEKYSNPIGSLLFEFLDANLSNTTFIKRQTIKYGSIALNTEYHNIHFADYLREHDEEDTDFYEQNYFEDKLDMFSNLIINEYRKLQIDLKNILDFVYNINNENYLNDLTPSQRYYIYLEICSEDEHARIYSYLENVSISQEFDFSKLINNISSYKDVEDLADQIRKKDTKNSNYKLLAYLYSFSSLICVYYFSALHLVQNNIPIKKCQNCGKYFIPENRISSIYCNRIYENKKTCKEIGAINTYNEKLKQDEINFLYRRTLSAKKMLANRNPDIPIYLEKYEKWKKEANEFKKNIKKRYKN